MSTTREMIGVEDLTGQRFGNVIVRGMVSRHPLTWELSCILCGSSWNERHERVRYGRCRNNSCGRTASENRATLASTGQAMPGVRSRDSESARRFQREQHAGPVIRWTEPTVNADPDGMRHYLDWRGANA
jgi:hypothetical protein